MHVVNADLPEAKVDGVSIFRGSQAPVQKIVAVLVNDYKFRAWGSRLLVMLELIRPRQNNTGQYYYRKKDCHRCFIPLHGIAMYPGFIKVALVQKE
ncbi:MAG: hypothetical protein Q7J27_07120 [Syntrophales bacterium]|nr:hypothetical protein [Syntrophales bacterium]